MKIKQVRRDIFEFSSISFVDIIMNLFLFFFITFSLVYHAGAPTDLINIKLPKAAKEATMKGSKGEILISLNEKDELYYMGEKVDLTELEKRLKKAIVDQKVIKAIVKADENVSYGMVVKIINLIKVSGLKNVNLAIQHGK